LLETSAPCGGMKIKENKRETNKKYKKDLI